MGGVPGDELHVYDFDRVEDGCLTGAGYTIGIEITGAPPSYSLRYRFDAEVEPGGTVWIPVGSALFLTEDTFTPSGKFDKSIAPSPGPLCIPNASKVMGSRGETDWDYTPPVTPGTSRGDPTSVFLCLVFPSGWGVEAFSHICFNKKQVRKEGRPTGRLAVLFLLAGQRGVPMRLSWRTFRAGKRSPQNILARLPTAHQVSQPSKAKEAVVGPPVLAVYTDDKTDPVVSPKASPMTAPGWRSLSLCILGVCLLVVLALTAIHWAGFTQVLGAILSALIIILAGLYIWGVAVSRSLNVKDAIKGLEAQIHGLMKPASVGASKS
jgi:hypothetical protein